MNRYRTFYIHSNSSLYHLAMSLSCLSSYLPFSSSPQCYLSIFLSFILLLSLSNSFLISLSLSLFHSFLISHFCFSCHIFTLYLFSVPFFFPITSLFHFPLIPCSSSPLITPTHLVSYIPSQKFHPTIPLSPPPLSLTLISLIATIHQNLPLSIFSFPFVFITLFSLFLYINFFLFFIITCVCVAFLIHVYTLLQWLSKHTNLWTHRCAPIYIYTCTQMCMCRYI